MKGKMEERTERESNRRRRKEKWQTLWCCRDQQRACRMGQASAEKLDHTRHAEKKRVTLVPQREKAVGKYSRVVCPEHQIVKRAGSVREVKRAAAEEKERDEYSSLKRQ